MTRIALTTLALAGAAFSTPALAQDAPSQFRWSGAYLGAGVETQSFPDEGGADGFTDLALTVRAGADIWRYFGVEAEGAVGFGSRNVIDTPELERDAGYAWRGGLALRGRMPVGERTELFGKLGVGVIGVDVDSRVFRADGTTQFDFSDEENELYGELGAGGVVWLGERGRDGVRLDIAYRAFADYSDEDSDSSNEGGVSVGLGYVRKF